MRSLRASVPVQVGSGRDMRRRNDAGIQMKQGMSVFVSELVTGWLKEIRDPATLNEFDKLIKERRAMLMIETHKEMGDRLVANMKNCKSGQTLFLSKPLPNISEKMNPQQKFAKYLLDDNRMECKFWQWQPRKKLLWVTVPWKTSREHHGQNFILMTVKDIHRLQPGRTEVELRTHQVG